MGNLKTEWNFEPLLKEDFSEARKKIENAYLNFRDKWKNNQDYLEKPEVLKEALDEYNDILENYIYCGSEGYYYHLRAEVEENNSEVRAKYGSATDVMIKLGNEIMFFSLKLGKVPKEKQREFLKNDLLKDYKHYLETLFANAKYFLKEGEERILNLKSKPAHELWEKMVSSLLSKETRKVLDIDGKTKEKTYPEMLTLLEKSDKKIREDSAKKLNEIFDKYIDVAEFEINALLEDKKINDNLKSAKRPDEFRNVSNDLENDIVDNLIEAVVKRNDISKRYYELKCKLLNLDKLKYYEKTLGYGNSNKKYSYEDSIELINKVFYSLDEEFGEIFEVYLKNGQIDVFPRKGKRGGAFCSHWLKKYPTYIMLNHTDSLRDILTIAHETGHGINNEFMKKQKGIYFDTPFATAETASTFMEDFVFRELLEKADDEEKLFLMIQKLNDEISTIQRQIGFYNFEKELHETYRSEGYLSKEKIGKIFRESMEEYLGEFVDCSGCENWWIYIPHIREYFYTYAYAFGLLVSKSMQNLVREDKNNIELVKDFLSAGTSESPKDIFIKMGIDISDKEFWNKGLDEVENLLNETENLAKKLGKI